MAEKSRESPYLSIKIGELLMRIAGFWYVETSSQQRILDWSLYYTLFMMAIALYIVGMDTYFSWGEFYALTYAACSSMPVLVVLLKIAIFFVRRQDMINMIQYTQDKFWLVDRDEYMDKVLAAIDRKGRLLIGAFTFFTVATCAAYTLAPIVDNIGRNKSDRILPFTLYLLPIPTALSPQYEILFFIEFLACVHVGICFCCFDNFLCLLNMHAAGQFRILQHKLEMIFDHVNTKEAMKYSNAINAAKSSLYYERFKKCVAEHLNLISYMSRMEDIFRYTTLCQLLISSAMLCVVGFQVFLGRGTFIRRMIFLWHTNACFFQLFVITSTAHEVLEESGAVGTVAYKSAWQRIDYEDSRLTRKALLLVMTRSNRPCCLSAGGFFTVSIDTFVKALSTTLSYFALLRKFNQEIEG